MIYKVKDNISFLDSMQYLKEDECQFSVRDVRIIESVDKGLNLIYLEDYNKLLESNDNKETALFYLVHEHDLDVDNIGFIIKEESLFDDISTINTVKQLQENNVPIYIKPMSTEVYDRILEECIIKDENSICEDFRNIEWFVEESAVYDHNIKKRLIDGFIKGTKEGVKDVAKRANLGGKLAKAGLYVAGVAGSYKAGSHIARKYVKGQLDKPEEKRSEIFKKIEALHKKYQLYTNRLHAEKDTNKKGFIRKLLDKIRALISRLSNRSSTKQ